MSFAAPIWLLALAPWAALTVWLLWGRRRRVGVPFLDLWRGPVRSPRATRAVQVPPVALACAIAAMLLAILGMAAPMIRARGGVPLVVIFDRGLTMSSRVDATVRGAEDAIAQRFGNGPRTYLAVPLTPGALHPDRFGHVVPEPTAVDTTGALRRLVREQLNSTRVPILVFSDRPLHSSDPRLVEITPEKPLRDVGIAAVAARATPRAQVMATLKATFAAGTIAVRVESGQDGSNTGSENLGVVPSRDVFIDMPVLGKIVRATLDVKDDIALDDVGYLVRSASWPRIEPRFSVPAELARMIEAYRKSRPSDEGSSTIALASDENVAGSTGPAVIVDSHFRQGRLGAPPADVRVSAHPVTAHVDWHGALAGASVAVASPPGGWDVVVSAGGVPVVAVAPTEPRRVWIGFASDVFARTSDYVIFWTNVFDWAGQGGESFSASTVTPLGSEWSRVDPAQSPLLPTDNGLLPGIYRRDDGTLLALNAPPVPAGGKFGTGWRDELARLPFSDATSTALAPAMMLATLMLALVSALTWRRAPGLGLTGFSAPRSV